MWIAFRLWLALVGFVIRRSRRARSNTVDGSFEGVPYGVSIKRRKGKIEGFSLRMPRKSPTWLRFHLEGDVDRWVKRIGIAKESQTGDAEFDALVYVTCDHPFIERALSQSPQLRGAVTRVLELSYDYVEFDGKCVVIARDSGSEPTQHDMQLLKRVWAASDGFEALVPSRLDEPFLWKAVIIESLIWSLLGYAAGALVQSLMTDEDVHVSPESVVVAGLAIGALLFFLLVGAITLFMRGSSRGHRVIVESALILAFAIPTTGIQLIADTNRALDSAPPQTITAVIDHCEVREHRRKRRKSYSYHLKLARDETSAMLPQWVEITRAGCDAAQFEPNAEFTLRPGRWGLPWYQAIRIGDSQWKAGL